jgi:hypothetical protein
MSGKRIVVLVVIASLILSGGVVMAAQLQSGGSTRLGGAVEAVRVSGSIYGSFINSGTFITIGSTNIIVPAGHTDLVVARWTSSTQCGAAPGTNEACYIQLLANQSPMLPDTAYDIFDEAPYGGASLPAHRSIERYLCLSGGANDTTYRINVQGRMSVGGSGGTFTYGPWTLAVERSAGCTQ